MTVDHGYQPFLMLDSSVYPTPHCALCGEHYDRHPRRRRWWRWFKKVTGWLNG